MLCGRFAGTDGKASKSSESKTSPEPVDDIDTKDVGRSRGDVDVIVGSGGMAGMGANSEGERGGISETPWRASCSIPVRLMTYRYSNGVCTYLQ